MGPPEAVEAIKKSQLSLLQLPTARNEQTLKNNIKQISVSINKKEKAGPLLNHIDQTMGLINKQQLPTNTSVAFLLQIDGRSLSLAGSNTTGNDIITLLGGINLGQHNGYHTVSAEALLSLEPDVIIVANQNMSQPPVETLLKYNPLLQHTPAGQKQKIIGVDGRVLVAGISLASIDALATMAKRLKQEPSTTSSTKPSAASL